MRPVSLRSCSLNVFSTSPQSTAVAADGYVKAVVDVAHWSEEAGCEGILVYTDNSLVDPWLVAQIIIQNTCRLCPLVAVQPAYMHPYSVAKMISSLAYCYGRRVCLNMVAGGFTNDLLALNDTTPHDLRYARVVEYTSIIKELLRGQAPVSYHGQFYVTEKLRLNPPFSPELLPDVFLSGSSEAGLKAAQALGAIAIKYPQPADSELDASRDRCPSGVRVGIIARQNGSAAWTVAHERFPEDRKGQLTHQLAMATSDSVWHAQLSRLGNVGDGNPYWLVPFENYKTFCPYLVGSYDQVATELSRYVSRGYETFILDIPPTQEELEHAREVIDRAQDMVTP